MKKALVIVHTGLRTNPRVRRKDYDQVIDLYLDGAKKNVEIRFINLEEKIVANLAPITRDLLEIASVLYVADTSISRGDVDVYGRSWQRSIRFIIPVRRLRKWKEVTEKLSALVTYLSGDAQISFDFRAHAQPSRGRDYLDFPPGAPGFQGANEIVLFSGGLDSLGGSVELLSQGRTPLLISHRSSPSRTTVQEALPQALKDRFGGRIPLMYAWITRKGAEASDNTQRLRSFLYMSLAAVAACELRIQRIHYCENGIVTLNLPLSEQRIGTRSTRTTHPRVLLEFAELVSEVLGAKIEFHNPLLFHTKRDVVEGILNLGCAHLIALTISCSRTFAVQKTHRHCGVCFQCITRRFAMIAAGAESSDPVADYVKDIFSHALAIGMERGNALDWVRFNLLVNDFSPEGLFQAYPQLRDTLQHVPGGASENAKVIHAMYERNASDVLEAIRLKHNEHYGQFVSGHLPSDCLVGLIGSRAHLTPRIADFLSSLETELAPRILEVYAKREPIDEDDLQRETGVILKAAGHLVEREAPQVAFSIVKTRPDYSFPESGVFLEFKLFKQTTQRTEIVDGILADIQKYRTKCQGMLFVIFQTKAFIADAVRFASDLSKDPSVRIAVVTGTSFASTAKSSSNA